jgi:biopolymer transport protein ExbD
MAEKRKESEENVMVIIMEDGVRYERLVDALSVAKETGITRVSLRNQSEGK